MGAINTENIKIAFELMGQGMLGIFIVMAAISLIVYIFTKFSK